MDKHSYLAAKQRGDFSIIYEYYKEHFDIQKHGPMLSFQDFTNVVRMWGAIVFPNMMKRPIEYYDQKFGVTKLMTELGQTIKEY
jgi:hypothetical protein